MLCSLYIHNIILIDTLTLDFNQGFHVLTGETGAGKSILLDALSLALGGRAEPSVMRLGAPSAHVVAAFNVPSGSPLVELLAQSGVTLDEGMVMLKRTLSLSPGGAFGTKGFINDQPVTLALLATIGAHLVDIHGQFDALLDPAQHRACLDTLIADPPLHLRLTTAYAHWKDRESAYQVLASLSTDERKVLLAHYIQDFTDLAPQPDEEASLVAAKNRLSQVGKRHSLFTDMLTALEPQGAEAHLIRSARAVDALCALDSAYAPLAQEVAAALIHTQEAISVAHTELRSLEADPERLEALDDRLSALRTLARKHHVQVAELPELWSQLTQDYANLDAQEEHVLALRREADAAKLAYAHTAQELSEARQKVAEVLETAVIHELPALKMERALFKVQIDTSAIPHEDDHHWGPHGWDKVTFMVAPNGSTFGSLKTIASGGERSRFMLALKVAMVGRRPQNVIQTLIFDEIDSGVGGAVATAVGTRLATLAEKMQVLCVTHAPQVAALGRHHVKVCKESTAEGIITSVRVLSPEDALEEVARMIAGHTVTPAARAAALALKNGTSEDGGLENC